MLEINKSILKVAHKRSFVVPDSFTGLSSETVAYETGCVTCTVCFYIVFFFFKLLHLEQLTLRSITLLSSLVSWLTVALPS